MCCLPALCLSHSEGLLQGDQRRNQVLWPCMPPALYIQVIFWLVSILSTHSVTIPIAEHFISIAARFSINTKKSLGQALWRISKNKQTQKDKDCNEVIVVMIKRFTLAFISRISQYTVDNLVPTCNLVYTKTSYWKQ